MQFYLKRAINILLIICILLSAISAAAEKNTADAIDECIGGIIAYNEKISDCKNIQEFVDNYLSINAGNGAEWYVIALSKAGYQFKPDRYIKALNSYINTHNVINATSLQRIALATLAMDYKSDFLDSAADASIGNLGVMSLIYGLHLLNNGVPSALHTVSSVTTSILSLQNEDGGWAVSGSRSDADVTAMAVQSLAVQYKDSPDVMSAVDRALGFLSLQQLENGCYQSYGTPNAESCAQVITALSALGIDPLSDSRFIKNGNTVLDAMLSFRLEDGSFCHAKGGIGNPTATVQAFYSLIALKNMYAGYGPFLVFSEHISSAEQTHFSYKIYASIAICALFVVYCIILILRRKHSFKSYLFAALLCGVLLAVVLFTDISSSDSYYSAPSRKNEPIGKVMLSITCNSLKDFSGDTRIPSDGIILGSTSFEISENETVYDILTEACRTYGIQMENSGSALGAHGLAYISGINYLYELEFGDLSGWMYFVNGTAPSVGCGEYKLNDGDVVEWKYTKDLGRDL